MADDAEPVCFVHVSEAAVRAALQLRWSNGQTEGQITRLKLIRRQMFGRAKHDLLRARVLQAAEAFTSPPPEIVESPG